MSKPRVSLTGFHGVFAPNSNHRVTITPAKRGKGASKVGTVHTEPEGRTPMEQRVAMTWACRVECGFRRRNRRISMATQHSSVRSGSNSGLHEVFDEGIGRVTNKDFRLGVNEIPVNYSYP